MQVTCHHSSFLVQKLPTTMPQSLESYLHAHIPISRAMGVKVLVADGNELRLAVPLAPNINHFASAFGGSESSVAILAAWCWLTVRMRELEPANLVVQRTAMEYLRPVTGDFEVVCVGADTAEFLRSLDRKGKGRIEISASILFDGEVAATLRGTFVAKRNP